MLAALFEVYSRGGMTYRLWRLSVLGTTDTEERPSSVGDTGTRAVWIEQRGRGSYGAASEGTPGAQAGRERATA